MTLYIELAAAWGLMTSLFVSFPNSCRDNPFPRSRQLAQLPQFEVKIGFLGPVCDRKWLAALAGVNERAM
jgi:hypothetical protein